jgi:hypothetical protein
MVMRGTGILRAAVAGIAVAFAVLVASPPASAQYEGGTTLTASDINPACGATITLTGTGFQPDAVVKIDARGTTATATTGSDGSFTTSFTMPGHPCKGETVVVTAADGVDRIRVRLKNGDTPTGPPAARAHTAPSSPAAPASMVLARGAVVPITAAGVVGLARRKRALHRDADRR